jgi:putative glutamine amidotransferase
MKLSPIIGVTPLWDSERKSLWILPDYLDGIKAAGGVPVVPLYSLTNLTTQPAAFITYMP